MASSSRQPLLIVGGGIGGLAAALALARADQDVKVLEQADELKEIGAGVQFGPNAFTAYDSLGVGPAIRRRAVVTDFMVMMDAVDGTEVAKIPLGADFRERFGNPYAVAHRAEVHESLLESVRENGRIELVTSTLISSFDQDAASVVAVDSFGRRHSGSALVGCDGVKSVIRDKLVGDTARVSGHVVYRAVIATEDFPANLRWNAPAIWVAPNCHIVHYPVKGGAKFNLVVTFHSRTSEEWGVTDGSKEEVLSYFDGICDKAYQLLELPKSWRRWATADREPIAQWTFGRATLLGDAAHPMLQYLAQGACMAVEDAVTLGMAVTQHCGDFPAAFDAYQRARSVRTARVVLSTREFGRLCHAAGMERLVRNSMWKDRPAKGFYDALQWLYGWRAESSLAA